MRAGLRRAHHGLGLVFGGLFALIGLTGSLLVFYVEMDRAVHPALHPPAGGQGHSLNWDQALATLRQTYPDKLGPWRLEVTPDQTSIPARYLHPPERAGHSFAPMLVWLSPDGTRVLRRDYWGDTGMTWIYDLHYRLLLGEAGSVVLGLAGIALVLLLVMGLILWWPRASWRKALRYKADAARSRRLWDHHKLVGLISLVPLVLLGVTGAMLALPKPTAQVLTAFGLPPAQSAPPVSAQEQGRQISVHQAIAVAQAHWPQAQLAWIEVPGPGNGAFALRVQLPGDPSRRFPHSYVWVDQYRGTILATQDVRRSGGAGRFLSWLHPLHDGSIGGLGLRLLFCAIGLAPAVLWMTGQKRARLRRHQRR